MAHSVRVVMDWVLAQTLDRKRQQLEAEEMEYAERLAQARKREVIMRHAAKGRVRKKPVGPHVLSDAKC